jgi:hypothetical protein
MAQLFKPKANSMARASVLGLALGPVILFYAGSTITRSPANTKADVPLNQPVPFSHKHHAFELGIDCRYCHVSVEKSKTSSVPATEVCMSCHSQIWTNSPLLEPVRTSYEKGLPIEGVEGVGWNQVNKLPEFVYFDHSIHIARGINCNHCHGPIQEMTITWKGRPFSMAWCLECHREPEKYLYKDTAANSPREQVFGLYRKLQNKDPLTPHEEALAHGQDAQVKTKEELQTGEELLKAYKVKKQQLTDCYTCHR